VGAVAVLAAASGVDSAVAAVLKPAGAFNRLLVSLSHGRRGNQSSAPPFIDNFAFPAKKF
jgi:hypothetical protein